MSDITKLYVTDGGTLTLREPCKEDFAMRNEPSRSTQKTLDHLADNDIVTSVIYGDKDDAEENSDERYYRVKIFLSTAGRVFSPPPGAKSFEEAIRNGHEAALDLEWLE
ncbi:hypothetical protein LCGC14_0835870 [marine sediment metagenome]|uniref:Uncharacterized protein n=1 Tax=marine sediment metagenome TaxID=412755 RepID=A0A0F9PZU6_9ZZZZ